MEFKVGTDGYPDGSPDVDIGTEWNLKEEESGEDLHPAMVDIGTEWNLNGVPRIRPFGFVEIAKKVEC